MQRSPDVFTRTTRLVAWVLIAALVLWLLYRLRFVLLLLVAAGWVAYAIAPLVHVFSGRKRQFRPLGIAFAYLTVIGALIIVGVVAVGPAVSDARRLATNLPEYAQHLQQWSTGAAAKYLALLPADTRPLFDQLVREASDRLRDLGQSLAQRTLAFVFSLSTLLGAGALALVISILLLTDTDYLKEAAFRLIPRAYHRDATALLEEMNGALSGLVRGQIVVGMAVGLTLWIGLGLLHVQYAALLATFTGIAQLVPDIGAVVGLIAGVTLAAFQGARAAVETAVLFLVVYQLAARVLGPWVFSRAVHMHSLIIILVTVSGAVLAGIVGALLAVPFAAVAKVLLDFAYRRLSPRFGLSSTPES